MYVLSNAGAGGLSLIDYGRVTAVVAIMDPPECRGGSA